ncbi:MAG: division/cell wall cluster transcriptional repressor MraZ [Thermoleophilia bacterium]|nr:division/cell wall cluster transcriptional repressor MraZ [Thermoleophilia bacterium]MDH4344979.1 division/cell wall cluster transcriptional repressor MraZ [Thermoleophilia bacterium]MDH5333243.1 division/cell wall cluster transcriptional repressor MraZ [Thermoleophilia bacterium]
MFYGEYEHTIDEKSRLTLPARFRTALAGGVVLSRGIDACIDVYPRVTWESGVRARVAELDSFSREARQLKRHVFGGATEEEPDRQGRVLVPPALVRHADLDREVVIAGVDDHLEIWDRAAWAEHLKAVEGSADDVAERLAEKRR